MDKHHYVRIATTVLNNYSERLFILDQDDHRMEIILYLVLLQFFILLHK